MESKVVTYKIDTQKDADLNFVMIGDIHSFYRKEHFKETMTKIKDMNPDFILVAGDMVNTGLSWSNDFDKIKEMFQFLSERQAVISILGNHDIFKLKEEGLHNYESLSNLDNVYPLVNDSVELRVRETTVHIDGYVSQKNAHASFINTVKEKLAMMDKEKAMKYEERILSSFKPLKASNFNILLNHDPTILKNVALKKRANEYDLVTGAHMHNGYVPLRYTIQKPDFYDLDYRFLLTKGKLEKKDYSRGVIYGNSKQYVLVDQMGNFYFRSKGRFRQITEAKAIELIRMMNSSPIVITGGINKYFGMRIDAEEITKVLVKKKEG